jgi:predicted SAM-dependent methyltransferase
MAEVKLHLGCGKRYIPKFIHVDLLDLPHINYQESVDNLSIFRDDTIDLIYACHVLEHFPRADVARVLAEWYRVLKPGGVLRLAVPGFEEIVAIYQKYHDMSQIIGPLMGGQDYQYNFHYVCFDYSSLARQLMEAGFRHAYRYDWRQTEHADVDDFSQAYIPHMDKDHGLPVSLNVEAVK